ncbi:MAG: ABC transporter ATP-binding protein [Deinococcales bacterium]|nr:ABC transporter ATP-binding protein [Deinococcales bacterium]
MIRFESVSKRFGDVLAVDDVTLHVPEGELVVLIGPSGCGKTTCLKMINRLVEPSAGRVLVNGRDVAHEDPQALRRGIGYVIQSVGLFPHLSVKQNVQVVPSLLGWPERESARRADELLAAVGLEPATYRDRYPRELSGGQQQRVGVARALAVDPPILLMDEPFGAVDPLTRERLQDEFLELQQRLRKTVVLVTHDIREAVKLADRVCLMNGGRIEQYATPEELLRRPRNRFVRQFVGSDRALTRLSRIRVSAVMESAAALDVRASVEAAEAALATNVSLYVTEDGALVGWLMLPALREAGSVQEGYTPLAPHQALTPSDDVREALSRMLELGVANLPVVERSGRLVGQLGLEDVVTMTAPTEDAPGAAGGA